MASDVSRHSDKDPPSTGVLVSCRLRGLSPAERATGRDDAVYADPTTDSPTVVRVAVGATATATAQTFRFDHVFSPDASQSEVFAAVGAPCVRDLLRGYNCTLLAYGQTGSGKTYTTMFGGGNGSDASGADTEGLVPRLLEQLFDAVTDAAQAPEAATITLTASFVEVYQERLRDLLLPVAASSSSARPSSLQIREDKTWGNGSSGGHGGGSVWVDGATEISLLDLATARAALARGLRHRAVGATQMNRDSSRSHAVFAVTLTRRTVTGDSVRARLCVVDLAGSEQAKKTRASGTRLDEAKHINRSLSALGNVIHALTSSGSSSGSAGCSVATPAYVPYRDSKLTRLLQSSLGGNAKTHLLLTCATAWCHADESLSTLRFGARATRMQNTPTMNVKAANAHAATNAQQQCELLEMLQQKIESLCRYIRELEDAAASTVSCACQASGTTRSEPAAARADITTTSVSAVLDDAVVDVSDPADDEDEDETVATVRENAPLSSDLLMQAELLTLRKALDDMQRLQRYEELHATTLQGTVASVERHEIEKLHHRQAHEIQRLEAELTSAEHEIATLQRALRDQHDATAELTRQLHVIEARLRQADDAASAESEILRRRLDQSHQRMKMAQVELAESRAETDEVRLQVEQGERDRVRLRDELDTVQRDVQATVLASPVAAVSPSKSPPRSVGKSVLRPMTVASGAISSAAIQSWWAGDAPTNNYQEEQDDKALAARRRRPMDRCDPGDGASTRREEHSPLVGRSSTSMSVYRHRLDTLGEASAGGQSGSRTPSLSEGGDREDDSDRRLHQLHTSGGARPFRARLVGLLNSLEAETSSYKELLRPNSSDIVLVPDGPTLAVGTPQPRPCHPRSHVRRHRLPELPLPP